MTEASFAGQLGSLGLVPVVERDRLDDAEPLFGTLAAGGLPAPEITLRATT